MRRVAIAGVAGGLITGWVVFAGGAALWGQPAPAPSTRPAADTKAVAAVLLDIAKELRNADMVERAKVLEAIAVKINNDQAPASEDLEAMTKQAEQFSALAPSYRALRAERATMLRKNSERLLKAVATLGPLAKSSQPPAAPTVAASGAELTLTVSYALTTPPRPPVTPPRTGGTPPPPPPPPVKHLSIRVMETNETFNNASALLANITARMTDKLEGLTVKINVAPEITFAEVQEVVRALAGVQKIATIRIENLPVRTAPPPAVEPPTTAPANPPITTPAGPPAGPPRAPVLPGSPDGRPGVTAVPPAAPPGTHPAILPAGPPAPRPPEPPRENPTPPPTPRPLPPGEMVPPGLGVPPPPSVRPGTTRPAVPRVNVPPATTAPAALPAGGNKGPFALPAGKPVACADDCAGTELHDLGPVG